jgi:hypothetical protein
LDANDHKSGIGRIPTQKRMKYTPCPILKMSVNGASTVFGLAGWLFKALDSH